MLSLVAAVLLSSGQAHARFKELVAKPGRWLQQPTTLKALHGKVVVLDYWDYTCNNCIRTFPYLREWYRRYHSVGFEIIGIHTPEFEFAKDPAKVLDAAKRFGMTWPILNDPQREDWWEFGVFAWPTKFILNGDGLLVYKDVGEGYYDDFEKEIQKQLLILHPGIKLPPIMKAVRATDKPGAVCQPVTAELYTYIKGLPKKRLGYGPEDIGVRRLFKFPTSMQEGVAYISGIWTPEKHFLTAEGAGSTLKLRYMAKDVNVVLTPTQQVQIEVLQDGKPVAKHDLGDDVKIMGGRAVLTAKDSRMYSILKNKEWSHRTLELRVLGHGLHIYAFSFSTDCLSGNSKKQN